ncbi:MAG: hypothetical protein QOF51_3448 [Chloroflexota bacterium]|nr:hypothetical protein [Chloroflexota bacterium]
MADGEAPPARIEGKGFMLARPLSGVLSRLQAWLRPRSPSARILN